MPRPARAANSAEEIDMMSGTVQIAAAIAAPTAFTCMALPAAILVLCRDLCGQLDALVVEYWQEAPAAAT